MQIKIAQRYRPFTHLFGAHLLIPGTYYTAKVYPDRLQLFYAGKEISSIAAKLTGPLTDFIAICDLEKWRIEISGKSREGFFRYYIWGIDKTLFLEGKKGKIFSLEQNPIKLAEDISFFPKKAGRIALGMSKKLEWDRVCKRANLPEIVPVWYQAATCYPKEDENLPFEYLYSYFQAGFSGILAPQKPLNIVPEITNPFALLSAGAQTIESLLLQVEKKKVVLPKPTFVCGRATDLITPFALFSLQWSGYKMKIVTIKALEDEKITLSLSMRSFRLRKNRKDQGKVCQNGESFVIEKGISYTLDCFKS